MIVRVHRATPGLASLFEVEVASTHVVNAQQTSLSARDFCNGFDSRPVAYHGAFVSYTMAACVCLSRCSNEGSKASLKESAGMAGMRGFA